MIRFTKLGALLTLLLPIFGVGCATVAKQSPLMKATDVKYTVDAETLRIRVRALASPFGGYIEESGDRIGNEATDPEVRRQALIWKADGLPAVRAALFRPDPLVALLDTWALTEQLTDYFESGRGRERLGTEAPIALDAARKMRDAIVELVRAVVPGEDLSRGEQFVNDWARAHPIAESIAGRESMLREAGNFKTQSGTGGLKLVGSLAVTMDDMLRQIEGYTANIPKQARWEAELAVLEMVEPANLDRAVQLLPAVLDSVDSLAGTAEDLPSLIAGEREAVLDAIRRERIETLEFLRQERLETLDRISEERVAVLEGSDAMRVAVTESIHGEIELIAGMIRQERARTMEEAEAIAGRSVDVAFQRATDLVDHVFLRVLLLLGLIFVGCLLLMLLAWRLFRGRALPAAA